MVKIGDICYHQSPEEHVNVLKTKWPALTTILVGTGYDRRLGLCLRALFFTNDDTILFLDRTPVAFGLTRLTHQRENVLLAPIMSLPPSGITDEESGCLSCLTHIYCLSHVKSAIAKYGVAQHTEDI